MDRSPSAFMKSFFAEIPDLDELASDAIAHKYMLYCFEHVYELTSLVEPVLSANVWLMDDRTSLSSATKKSMLVSDYTIIGHDSGTKRTIRKGITDGNYAIDSFYIEPSLQELGEWLRVA